MGLFGKKQKNTEQQTNQSKVAEKETTTNLKKGRQIPKNVLVKPLITEKATNLLNENKYVFLVSKDATKSLVKENIAYKYNVKVEKVNIVNLKGKTKYFRNIPSKTKSVKKAIVFLKKGEKIDIQ